MTVANIAAQQRAVVITMRAALVLLALPGAALAASGAVYLDDSALASRAAASARFLALVQQQEDPGRPHAALFVAGEASQAGGAPAVGSFNDTLNALGWTNLWIAGNTAAFDDEQVAYAAGYLEGVLTWERIWHTLVNTGANFTWDPALEVGGERRLQRRRSTRATTCQRRCDCTCSCCFPSSCCRRTWSTTAPSCTRTS